MRSVRWGFTALLVGATLLQPDARADAGGIVDLANELKDVWELVERGERAREYAIAVLDEQIDGQVPPKPTPETWDGDEILKGLQEAERVVTGIEYPLIGAVPPLPDPAVDFTRYRADLSSVVAAYERECRAFDSARDTHAQLVEYESAITLFDRLVIEFTEFLGRTYERWQVVPFVEELIGLRWIDFELSVRPATARLLSAARDARKRVETAHAARRGDLSRALGNLRVLLQEEQTRLQSAVDRADREREALEAEARAVAQLLARVRVIEADVSAIEGQQRAAAARLSSQQSQLVGLQQSLASAQATAEARQRDVAVPFESSAWRCPRGNPYSKCTHNDLKYLYDNNRGRLMNELRAAESSIASLRGSIASVQQQIRVTQNEIAALAQRVQARRQELAAARTEYDRAVNAYQARFLEFLRTSRWAELGSAKAGSRADEAMVGAAERTIAP